jgi:CMP-N,N'-diacetyllegionaminic acid synthase
MKVLALIPARAGSKGVPDKNIRPIAGKSLVEWTLDGLRESAVCDRIVLSTDSPALLDLAHRVKLDAPFVRPSELAGDGTPMLDVILHALAALAATGYRPDALLLAQPTSPMRQPAQIREAVAMVARGEADSVCSVISVPMAYRPHYLMKVTGEGYLDYFMPDGHLVTRRQDTLPAYKRDGNIYLARTDLIETGRTLYGSRCRPLISDPEHACNIDTPEDWVEAEHRLLARSSTR